MYMEKSEQCKNVSNGSQLTKACSWNSAKLEAIKIVYISYFFYIYVFLIIMDQAGNKGASRNRSM